MELVRTNDFETVRGKYIDVTENTPDIRQHARWIYGRHPDDESLRAYIDNGEMYVLKDGEEIVGMVAVVMHQDSDYEPIAWAEDLENDEVATLHLLAVCPAYRGRSLGAKILEEVTALALKNGQRAIRLDTLFCNLPAQHMYEKAGFTYRGKQNWYAGNTGWIDFLFYEKVL